MHRVSFVWCIGKWKQEWSSEQNENVDRLHFLAWPPNICVRLAFGHDIFTAKPGQSNSHLDCYQLNVSRHDKTA